MIFESGILRTALSQNILHYEKGFVLNFLEKKLEILDKQDKKRYNTKKE